ncbi:hypothetical protein FA95DRAFT_1343160 [Auriscalpium vulgare]|uniref:Uncharacterized protein n=1 Tax=Auriscalpium vulgare TaxID=40419 RepID=A0ACB8RRI6_9AGAM|nr:hypothetical protein FA95DRAFT_1343160 [Auriscalpium vulgare]
MRSWCCVMYIESLPRSSISFDFIRVCVCMVWIWILLLLDTLDCAESHALSSHFMGARWTMKPFGFQFLCEPLSVRRAKTTWNTSCNRFQFVFNTLPFPLFLRTCRRVVLYSQSLNRTDPL